MGFLVQVHTAWLMKPTVIISLVLDHGLLLEPARSQLGGRERETSGQIAGGVAVWLDGWMGGWLDGGVGWRDGWLERWRDG